MQEQIQIVIGVIQAMFLLTSAMEAKHGTKLAWLHCGTCLKPRINLLDRPSLRGKTPEGMFVVFFESVFEP